MSSRYVRKRVGLKDLTRGGEGLVTSRNRRGFLSRLLDAERQLRIGSISKSQDGEAAMFAGLWLDRWGDRAV
jgi:hypothetical protein